MGMPVTIKGQATIPKFIRNRLGLTPGGQVDFEVAADGRVVLRKAAAPPAAPDRLRRLLGRATGGLSTDAIMAMTPGAD